MNTSSCHASRILSQLLGLNGRSQDLLGSQELLIPRLIMAFSGWHVLFTLLAADGEGAGEQEQHVPLRQHSEDGALVWTGAAAFKKALSRGSLLPSCSSYRPPVPFRELIAGLAPDCWGQTDTSRSCWL